MDEFLVLRGRLVALFALGNLDIAFALVFGCCLWSTSFSSGYIPGEALDVFHIFYVAVNLYPEAFALHSV